MPLGRISGKRTVLWVIVGLVLLSFVGLDILWSPEERVLAGYEVSDWQGSASGETGSTPIANQTPVSERPIERDPAHEQDFLYSSEVGVLVRTSPGQTEQTEGKKDTLRKQAVNTEGLSLPW